MRREALSMASLPDKTTNSVQAGCSQGTKQTASQVFSIKTLKLNVLIINVGLGNQDQLLPDSDGCMCLH